MVRGLMSDEEWAFFAPFVRLQQPLLRAAQPIQAHDRERVARAGVGEQVRQARTVHGLSGGSVAKNGLSDVVWRVLFFKR